MSNVLFPTLAGLGWSVLKAPKWSTKVQTATSGKELRTSLFSYPLYNITLILETMRDGFVPPGFTYSEIQTIIGFFNARQGSYDNFLYIDPTDYAATTQQFGTGNVTSGMLCTLSGTTMTITTIPSSGTVQANMVVTGGSIPAGTTILALTSGTWGGLNSTYTLSASSGSSSGTAVTASQNLFSLARNYGGFLEPVMNPAGASGFPVVPLYNSGLPISAANLPLGTGVAPKIYVGASLQALGTAYTMDTTGDVTFLSGYYPALGANVNWSGNFLYRCRFVKDDTEFENFMYNIWKASKVEMIGCLGTKI